MRMALAAHTFTPVAPACDLVHDIPGRLRFRLRRAHTAASRPLEGLNGFHQALEDARVCVSQRTGSVLVEYFNPAARNAALAFFGLDQYADAVLPVLLPRESAVAQPVEIADTPAPRNPLVSKVINYFLPRVLRLALAVIKSAPYIFAAVKALLRGRLSLEVLDGAALLVCLARRDFRALASITFFFSLGEYLSDWTRRKSRSGLAESLALNIDKVWVSADGLERQVLLSTVKPGDIVVVRAGSLIPVDGRVHSSEGMVNQASMTGESAPVHKRKDDSVYAGTILEEGELLVETTHVGNNTRITAIVRSIEESDTVKAAIQGKYEKIADAIVPYNFLLSGLVYALTRDTLRAGSVLLVDYSCAIRLATPLTIFTAMREAADKGVLIKGGKFLEAVAEADVAVFDKTGTLTRATPTLAGVVSFGKYERKTLLRLAACLEEHFPHPVGQAVVRAAELENLQHREEHAQVEFVVAHGIASRWNAQRVLIGSAHFVCEDGGIPLTEEQSTLIEKEAALGRSVLYLSIGNELAGILLIEDLLREDAASIVAALRADGIKRIIMLTGDSEHTAKSIARQVGITEYRAGLLPEDKAAFIRSLKRQGHTVMMIGDGINDSPALSEANIGIAMSSGADMACEIADMVLINSELSGLLLSRMLAREALKRIRRNFYLSLAWNSLFLVGGLFGVLQAGLSAFLHNATTSALAVRSVRPLLPATLEIGNADSV